MIFFTKEDLEVLEKLNPHQLLDLVSDRLYYEIEKMNAKDLEFPTTAEQDENYGKLLKLSIEIRKIAGENRHLLSNLTTPDCEPIEIPIPKRYVLDNAD